MPTEIETNVEAEPIDPVLSTEMDSMTEGDLSSVFSEALGQGVSQEPQSSQPDPAPVAAPAVEPVGAPTDSPQEIPVSETLAPLLENARQLGISTDGMTSETQLAQAVMDQIRSMQPYVNFAQQVIPHTDRIRQVIATPPGQAPQPVASPQSQQDPQQGSQQAEGGFDINAYLNEKYGGPSWKSEFKHAIDSGIVQRDVETGLWQPTPGYEIMASSLVPEMNAAAQHSSRFWQDVAQGNPYEKFFGVLKEPLMHEVRSLVENMVAGREQESQKRSVISDFETQHGSWLYQSDPSTGQRYLTDQGSAFYDTLADLRESGMSDPAKILATASRLHGLSVPAKQPAPVSQSVASQQPVAQAAVSQSPAPTQQAAPAAVVPAAVPAPATTPQSFINSALQRASHSTTAATTPDQPQVVSEGDLDSMFSNAIRSASPA